MTRRLLPLAVLVALGASSTAHAYQLIGYMWDPEEYPITFFTTDYLEDSLPQAPDPSTGLYYQEQVMVDSFTNWFDAECAVIEVDYGGQHPGNGGAANDGVNKIFFDDPADDYGTGINAVMVPRGRTTAVTLKNIGGDLIFKNLDNDIVFNDDIDWGTSEDIDDGRCSQGEMAIESTGTHEVGHLYGLDHSCEKEDICTDEAFRNATMFWSGGACDTSRAEINSDDIAGITALYGPFATFTTESDRFGSTPLTIDFEMVTDEDVESASWNFGDGETSTELEPSHEYTGQGQFTVSATFSGDSDQCGTWSFESRQLAYVLACEIPEPIFSLENAEAAGQTELPEEGIAYQAINQTDVSTYGCIDAIAWQIEQGGEPVGEPLGAWSPLLVFPEEGDYTVRMTAGGPAGRAEAVLEVSVEEAKGCATSGVSPMGGIAGLLLALVAGFRRRED